MNIKVNIHDKKQFIKRLLSRHTFKAIQSESILQYLLKDNELLELTHFVKDISKSPRAIKMTTNDTPGEPIKFYKGNVNSSNGWQAYHDLRLNNREQVFIQINMLEQYDELFYAVLEKNPYIYEIENFEYVLDIMKHKQQKDLLERQIDEALDENDQETFYHLSSLLKMLQED